MPSFIHRLDNLKDVRAFLSQDSVKSEGNYRIRINPEFGNLPSKSEIDIGDPIPDIYVEAMKITQKGNEEAYYLVTNLQSPEFTSYLVAESLILGLPEKSNIPNNITTDPYGSLNYEKTFKRAADHHIVNHLLEIEESLRGSVGVYEVEISEDTYLPGINPTPHGVMEAKLVVHMNQPVFIVDNIMDNYARPDMITVDFLSSEPVLLRRITPVADKIEAKNNDAIQKSRQEKENKIQFEARLFEGEKNIRERHIDSIKYLNMSIGHIMNVPAPLTIENKGEYVRGLLYAVRLASNIEKFKLKFGHTPEIAPNNELTINDKLNDLSRQLKLERFRLEHGFYLKANEKDEKMHIVIYDQDDAIIAHFASVWNDENEDNIIFKLDNEKKIEDCLPVYRMGLEQSSIYEIGKLVKNVAVLDDLWNHLSMLSFASEWDDLPALEYASIDDKDVYNLESFSAEFLMDNIESDKKLVGLVSDKVKELRSDLESKISKQNDFSSDEVMGL